MNPLGEVRDQVTGDLLLANSFSAKVSHNPRLRIWMRDHNSGKRYRVFLHRVVADLFCPKAPGDKFVIHRDGDFENNAASNLYWSKKRSP